MSLSNKSKSKQVSRKLAAIEKALKIKLTKFYNQNIKNSKEPIAVLRQRYERQVKIEIKKAVVAAYSEGISTLEEEISTKIPNFPLFLSNNDVTNIDSLTESYNTQFWETSGRLHDREIAPPTKTDESGEIFPLEAFDVAAALIGVSALFAWGAFNESVISKSQEVTNDLIMTPIPISGTTTTINIPISTKLMFMTAEDIKVDKKICFPLHGLEFDAFDPKIPIPPLHRHCRCRLIPTVDMPVL